MSWEAYACIIACYNMIIKFKTSKYLVGKSETVVSFYKQIVLLKYNYFIRDECSIRVFYYQYKKSL